MWVISQLFTSFIVFIIMSISVACAKESDTKAVVDPQVVELVQQTGVKININLADAKTITEAVKGIGKKRAEAIVAYREKHGEFGSLEQLAEVRGISKQFIQQHLKELQAILTVK